MTIAGQFYCSLVGTDEQSERNRSTVHLRNKARGVTAPTDAQRTFSSKATHLRLFVNNPNTRGIPHHYNPQRSGQPDVAILTSEPGGYKYGNLGTSFLSSTKN